MTDKTLTPMYKAGELVGYKERNAKETLIEAKKLIDTPDKWHKGDWVNDKGTCFCSMGAIAKVSGLDFDLLKTVDGLHEFVEEINNLKAVEVISEVVRTTIPYGVSVAFYNDSKGTTHKKVMELFDMAIAKA